MPDKLSLNWNSLEVHISKTVVILSLVAACYPEQKKEEFFIKQIPFVLWAKKAFFFGWMVDDFADKFIVIYCLIFGPRSKEKGLLHT